MKRIIIITFLLMLVLATFVVSVLKYQMVSADTVTVYTRGISDHGLILIGPASSEYETETAALLAGKSDGQKEFVNELKPFSVFIRNTNTRDVIAYRVRWEISGPAMKTIAHEMTLADPGVLEGTDPALVTDAVRTRGNRIIPNSSRYVALATSASYPIQPGIHIGIGTTNDNSASVTMLDDNELIETFRAELEQATDVTITLDGAVFSDGTFVGTNETGYFEQLKAQVAAKFDILKGCAIALKQNKTPSEIFAHIQTIADEQPASIAPASDDAAYYNYYRQSYATEIGNIRAVYNNDEHALSYVLQPLNRTWPTLNRVP
jgi:hypothetical protein